MIALCGGLLGQHVRCAFAGLHSLGLSRGQLRLQQRDMDVRLRDTLLQLLDVRRRRSARDARSNEFCASGQRAVHLQGSAASRLAKVSA